jgi:hypothetical protein
MPPLTIPLAADPTAPWSLALGALSVVAALVAIALAFIQTRQLKNQVERLANTETELGKTQQSITTLSEDMAAVLEQTQQSVKALSSEMYELLGISETARDTPGLFEQIARLADNCAVILPKNAPYVTDFVSMRLDELVTHTTQARAGSIELRPSDVARVALDLVEAARDGDRIFTTSYVNTADFWTRPSAKRYLERNKELIAERNVEINRIFLFHNEAAAEESRSEMDKQCAAGIRVRTALADELEVDLARDMFLLGERLAAEYVIAPGRGDILSVRIWNEPSREVAETRDRMQRLVGSSEPYHPHQEVAVRPQLESS